MKRFSSIRWVRLLLLVGIYLLGERSIAADETVLKADGALRWYRGNTHTHSHWSDGDDYLDMIALWYREHGYQFLVFTDHNVLADTERWIDVEDSKGGRPAYEKLKARYPEYVQERISETGSLEVRLNTFREIAARMNQPGKYLLIQGEEISDSFDEAPIHLNVANIQTVIPPMRGGSVYETIENNIRAALEQRKRTGEPMIVHLNHPNFQYAITAEDMVLVRGEKFFEVYNGHPYVNNAGDEFHTGTERIWDILLTRRLAEFQLPVLYGLATDDSHHYHRYSKKDSNPGRGWIMVLAPELSTKALIDALEAGRFYASSGVFLERVTMSPTELTIEVKPEPGETYQIDFIGTRIGYDPSSRPVVDDQGNEIHATRHYSDDIGETLATVAGTSATYHYSGDEIYVRARVTSSAPPDQETDENERKRAWIQPVVRLGN